MKKLQITLLVIIFPLLIVVAQNKDLVVTDLLDNHISIKVPSDFKELTFSEIRRDFLSGRRPDVVFTDKTNTVIITLKFEKTKPATQKDIEKYQEYYVGMSNYFGKCFDSGILTINAKKIGYQKVDGLTRNQKPVYTTMTFTDAFGVILEIRFFCPENKKEQWEAIADTIVRSIIIKE